MKGILFDLDGTLIDSMGVWSSLDISFVESKGHDFDYTYIDELKSKSVEELPDFFKRVYGFDSTVEEIYDFMGRTMKDHYRTEFEYKEGVEDKIKALKDEGYRMCITTATISDYCYEILERLRLGDYMDFVLTPDKAGLPKSDPGFFEKALDRLETKREKTYVFDDALYAIKNAKGLGLKAVGVYDESSKDQVGEIKDLSDHFIYSFEDLDISKL